MHPEHIFIGGAQKCGTSTLYASLAAHPDVAVAKNPNTGKRLKELHFYDRHWHCGFDWYASHFPEHKRSVEATPEYLCTPTAGPRIAKMFPKSKIIISLRDPVERAISQHNHYAQLLPKSLNWDWKLPGAGFDDNVRAELVESFESWRGLIGRGFYASQLELLSRFVPQDRIHVIVMEEWTQEPELAIGKILSFLELDKCELSVNVTHQREHTAEKPSDLIRQQLREIFREPNEQLFELLGREIPSWSS